MPPSPEQRELLLDRRVRHEAWRRRFYDPGDAVALINRAMIVHDEQSGEPQNVLQAMDELVARSPWLIDDGRDLPAAAAAASDRPVRGLARARRAVARARRGWGGTLTVADAPMRSRLTR